MIGLLKLVACTDQTNPSGVRIPDDEAAGGDGNPVSGEEGATGPVVTKDLCKVTKAGDAGKVIKATLLLPDAPLAGELFIDKNGVIACADKTCGNAEGYASATKIECKNAVVTPGLINAHDHISFANNPPHAPTKERFEHRHDWRKGARSHTKIATTAKAVPNSVEAAELRFAMSGVTAIAGAGGAAGMVRNVDGSPAQLEAGLKMPIANSDTFPLDDGNSTAFPTACGGFTSAKRRTAADIAPLKGYLPHIAEGIDASAHAEFVCQSDGPSVSDPGHDLIKRQTAVVHGMAVNPDDVQRYRSDMSILVWSPRSNVDLYGNTAPVALYANLGVPIALGTDWLPSGSMNMARELRCADELNQKYFGQRLSDKQLWQAVTVNAAAAIGADRQLGSLRKGMLGDIAIFDSTGKSSPYRAVIEAGVEDTILVLRGGKALYGDSALVKEPGSGGGEECEDIEVCRVTKKACVKKDLGKKSLADLQAAAEAVYPLYFCKDKTPKNEPSCAPSRGPTAGMPAVSSYSGAKAGDKDGDGIPDSKDNCPNVFNPIRPMDNGEQPDADGDGIGDACDKCPLQAGESCGQPNAEDVDGDGVPDVADNCPEDANPDQTDADHDGKGAACDRDATGASCDDRPNPDGECPTVITIAKLRDASSPNHPKPGETRAELKGVWVTAVSSPNASVKGFYVQEGTAEFSGIFVYTPNATVQVGNRVDLEADYVEFDGLSELTNPKITVIDPGTVLPFGPVVIDPAEYASNVSGGALGEPWEGMLCMVNGPVTVSAKNADTGTSDFDEFAVTSFDLRVDDQIYDPLDNTFEVGTTFSKLVGICGWSHGNRKIWPRDTRDYPTSR